LAATQVRAALRFGPAEFGLREIEGNLGGGSVSGDLVFSPRAEGLDMRGRIRVENANAADLLPGEGVVLGRLMFEAAAEGAGRSAVALVGSLQGSGSFKLENGGLARLNPAAFDAVIRAVERGLPIDVDKVRERMELALATGALAIPVVDGVLSVSSGQARLSPTSIQGQGAALALNGRLDLGQGIVDARMAMSGSAVAGSAARPEVTIAFKGPLEGPQRTVDVGALSSWLALHSVEQQSKKLDVLEGRASTSPAAGAPAVTAPVQPAAPNPAVTAPVQPAAPNPAGIGPALPRAAPKPKAPAAELPPPLPPPIDIRPSPPAPRAPRAGAPQAGQSALPKPPAPQAGAPQAGQPPPPKPPTPTWPRSLSEFLFGY
jgi:large subunit ribosomal protein L24